MSTHHLLLHPSFLGKAQKSLKVLRNTFLNRDICLVTASGIYIHVVQCKESHVHALQHMVHRDHSADITAMLFDPSDVLADVSLEASCVPWVLAKIMKMHARNTFQWSWL